jgi:hypothetical protein
MAFRRKQVSEGDGAEIVDVASPGEGVPRKRRPSFKVPLTDDGRPDLESLDQDKRQLLIEAVQAQAPAQTTVDPALAGMLIQAVAQLEGAILAAKFGLDRQTGVRLMSPKPPLDELLAKQCAVVLSKHNVFGRWGDEMALFALVSSWQAGAIQAMREAAAELQRAREEQRKAQEASAAGA